MVVFISEIFMGISYIYTYNYNYSHLFIIVTNCKEVFSLGKGGEWNEGF